MDRPRIDVHRTFEALGLSGLGYAEQLALARAIDRLGGEDEPAGVERVRGTRRLYRMRVETSKVLFVRDPERILLLALEPAEG